MREMLARMVRSLPCEVASACNGSEGIIRFLERPADLVITDLVMPTVDGYTVITVLRQISPKTRIIAATAGNGHDSRENGQGGPGAQSLPDRILFKPFFMRELMAAMQELFPLLRG